MSPTALAFPEQDLLERDSSSSDSLFVDSLEPSGDIDLIGFLDAFEDHPPVAPVFFAFRVMVGMGLLMLALAWGSQLWLKAPPRWLLWAFSGFTFVPVGMPGNPTVYALAQLPQVTGG